MISIVQICNLALAHIGQRPILALTDNSNEARKCLLYYDLAKDSVLRAHNWNFAKSIEPLALISEEQIPGWDFLYARPANCLFVRRVFNESNVKESLPSEFMQFKTPLNKKAIATNVDSAYAEFTRKITDPTDFDPVFIEALSFKLASLLSKTLTGDLSQSDRMEGRFLMQISDAKRSNQSEQVIRKETYNSFIDAR